MKVVQENKIMTDIMQITLPIIQNYIQDSTKHAKLAIDTNKTKTEANNEESNMNKFFFDDEEVPEGTPLIYGMQKHIALVYFAICWLFELFKKGNW